MPGNFSIFYADEVGVQGLGNLFNRQPYPWGREDLDLLESYRDIGRIRAAEPFLEDASPPDIYELDNKIFMFERENNGEKILTAVNRTDEPVVFKCPSGYSKVDTSDKVYTLRKSTRELLDGHGAIAIKKTS